MKILLGIAILTLGCSLNSKNTTRTSHESSQTSSFNLACAASAPEALVSDFTAQSMNLADAIAAEPGTSGSEVLCKRLEVYPNENGSCKMEWPVGSGKTFSVVCARKDDVCLVDRATAPPQLVCMQSGVPPTTFVCKCPTSKGGTKRIGCIDGQECCTSETCCKTGTCSKKAGDDKPLGCCAKEKSQVCDNGTSKWCCSLKDPKTDAPVTCGANKNECTVAKPAACTEAAP